MLQSIIESKFDKFRKEFTASIDAKFKAMKADIDLELAIHKNDIDELSETMGSLTQRISALETEATVRPSPSSENESRSVNKGNPLYNEEVTIIATNIKERPNENILETLQDWESTQVVAAVRQTGTSENQFLNSRGKNTGIAQ